MSFSLLDLSLLPTAFGLENRTGDACYCNATIQALLSCTSVINELKKQNTVRKSTGQMNHSEMNKVFLFISDKIKQSQQNVYNFAPLVVRTISMYRPTENNIRSEYCPYEDFATGQQSAGELTVGVLNAFENKRINNLVASRYRRTPVRSCCTVDAEKKCQNYNVIHLVKSQLENRSLEQAIMNWSETISDYKCDRCHVRGDLIIRNNIVLLSEILVIYLAKYDDRMRYDRWAIDLPETLIFNDGRSRFQYRLVATVEHRGFTIHSGHYWAHALRLDEQKNIKTYRLNDMQVAEEPFPKRTDDVAILFYHLESHHKFA
jgi:ubiquitin C-terminal hydrolase